MRIGDGSHLITPNLEAGLKEFRACGSYHLWIDALCIDQKNVQERNEQIKLMAGIYRNCKKLLVWLGVENDGSDIAMDYIEKSADAGGFNTWRRQMKPVGLGVYIKHLLERSWFRRAWVLQEYVLGNRQDAQFFAGRKAVSHHAMLLFSADSSQLFSAESIEQTIMGDGARHQLRENRSYLKHFFTISGPAINSNIPQIRGLFVLESGQETMEFWLEGSRSVAATDPRDKVYSLLGISDEISRLNDTPLCEPDELVYD